MKVVFIANGIDSSNGKVNISGGDVRWIEIAKAWRKVGVEVHVLTQKAGHELCDQLGLDAIFHILPTHPGTALIDYVDRVVNSFNIPDKLTDFQGLIYATTELLYDVLPAAIIKAKNPGSKIIVVAHHVTPIKRSGVPYVNSVLFYLNQRMGYLIAKSKADLILAVSNPTREDIIVKIGVPGERICPVACGVDCQGIRKALKSQQKEYEGVFIGRFAKEKGIFDLLDIWKLVCEKRPSARLAIIGAGIDEVESELKERIKKDDLGDNVHMLGRITDFQQKFSILNASKVFILPSYGENWGIVIGEALAAGLPVVAYDLPKIRPVWEDNVFWVPLGNRDSFASKIAQLLDDDLNREGAGQRGAMYTARYDWSAIAKNELDIAHKMFGTDCS